MPGSARDFGSYCVAREVVAAGVFGATNAGTAAVDMGLCRQGWLIISLASVTDFPTTCVLEHSPDNITFTTLQAVPNADVAATAFVQYDLANMMRWVRVRWINALAVGDSFWSVTVIGDLMIRAPFGT